MAGTWDYEQASVDALVQEAPLQDHGGQVRRLSTPLGRVQAS